MEGGREEEDGVLEKVAGGAVVMVKVWMKAVTEEYPHSN